MNLSSSPRKDIVRSHTERIKRQMQFSLDNGATILCLPNMVIPYELNEYFHEICKTGVLLITGYEYSGGRKQQVEECSQYVFPLLQSAGRTHNYVSRLATCSLLCRFEETWMLWADC